jgi:hypothetical protein
MAVPSINFDCNSKQTRINLLFFAYLLHSIEQKKSGPRSSFFFLFQYLISLRNKIKKEELLKNVNRQIP